MTLTIGDLQKAFEESNMYEYMEWRKQAVEYLIKLTKRREK